MAAHLLLLQQFPLLNSLPVSTLQQLAPEALLRTFNKREMVLAKGPTSPYLGFLLAGDGRGAGLHAGRT